MAPPDEGLLAALESMPGEVAAAARGLDDALARRRPAGGGLSLVEQAWHLADLETEGFGQRLRRLLAEDGPFLPDFDGARLAEERAYRTRPLEAGLAAFAQARRENLALLRALPAEAWGRGGRQEGVGAVTVADIPRLMRAHDDSHRAEIAALRAEPAGPA